MAASVGHELLREARELVALSWTQGADARAADGKPVTAWSYRATSWSLVGSVVAAYAHLREEERSCALVAVVQACRLLGETLDSYRLEEWNDAPERTHEDVLELIDATLLLPAPAVFLQPFSLN